MRYSFHRLSKLQFFDFQFLFEFWGNQFGEVELRKVDVVSDLIDIFRFILKWVNIK